MQCGAEWQSGGNEDPSEIEKLSGHASASAGQLLSCTVHTLNIPYLFVCFPTKPILGVGYNQLYILYLDIHYILHSAYRDTCLFVFFPICTGLLVGELV